MSDGRSGHRCIPFEAEPIENLVARYHDAVEDLWTRERLRCKERPGNLRKHVFDFVDGVRLLVSKDEADDGSGEGLLHVSCSVVGDDSRAWRLLDEVAKGMSPMAAYYTMCGIALEHLEQISGIGSDGLLFIGMSKDKQIPHWVSLEPVA